jgi:hypothetical protein
MNRLSAAFLAAAVLLSRPAYAASAPSGPDRRWSAFIENVFDSERSVGLRLNLTPRTALSVAGSFVSDQRDLRGPSVDTRSVSVMAGLRRYLSGASTRPFVDLEGSFSNDTVTSPAATLEGDRRGWGGGAFIGGQYFIVPALSITGRAGATIRRREQESAGDSTTVTVFESGVALAFHW